jgi:hypothetical protein
MSYDLRLVDENGSTFSMPESHHEGGTMPIDGYTESDFNITYNYGWFYYQCLDKDNGLRWLYGKTGKETIERLAKAIIELGTNLYFRLPELKRLDEITKEDRIYDYWCPTPGNAGAALEPLLSAAKEFPHGIWKGD